MKKIFSSVLTAILLSTVSFAYAQAPNSFNYQATLRDGSGNIIASQTVDLRVSLLAGSATGTAAYRETQSVTTNDYGTLSYAVGTGTVDIGTWAAIGWGSSTQFLKVEVSYPQGSPYVALGTPQQLVSVPYAISSKSAQTATTAQTSQDNHWTAGGSNIYSNNTGYVGIGTSAPSNRLHVAGSNTNLFLIENSAGNQAGAELWSGQQHGFMMVNGWAGNYPNDLGFGNSSTPSLAINLVSGNVGIAAGGAPASPGFPLTVNGYGQIGGSAAYGFYGSGGYSSQHFPAGDAMSIYSEYNVCAENFCARSDERIKNVTGRSVSSQDLAIINKLKVTDYTFRDVIAHGAKLQKGFLAQEVEKVMPEAVYKMTEYIPSIYAAATSVTKGENGNMIIHMKTAHNLAERDEVRLIADAKSDCMVDRVIDTNTFEVCGLPATETPVFVYGKKVDDLRSVNYDRIFCSGMGAIQELSKQVEDLKSENAALKQTTASLTQQLNTGYASLKTEFETLKSQFGIRSQLDVK